MYVFKTKDEGRRRKRTHSKFLGSNVRIPNALLRSGREVKLRRNTRRGVQRVHDEVVLAEDRVSCDRWVREGVGRRDAVVNVVSHVRGGVEERCAVEAGDVE